MAHRIQHLDGKGLQIAQACKSQCAIGWTSSCVILLTAQSSQVGLSGFDAKQGRSHVMHSRCCMAMQLDCMTLT